MNDDASDAGPAHEPFRVTVDDLSSLARIEEEEIPIIEADMLHHDRIDLESDMSAGPRVTIGLMLVCLAVFVRQLSIDGLSTVERVVDTGAVHGKSIRRGDFWRLISGGFMHSSGDHIFVNMLMLFVLGMACEHAFGRQGCCSCSSELASPARCWRCSGRIRSCAPRGPSSDLPGPRSL